MDRTMNHGTDRAAAFVFEAFVVLLIFAAGVTLTMTLTGVSPLALAEPPDETQAVHPTEEIEAAVSTSIDDGSLKETVLAWDDTNEVFVDGSGTPATGPDGQFISYPETAFATRIESIAERNGVQANIYAIPQYGEDGDDPTTTRERADRVTIVQRGSPDETAQVVETTIPIFEQDQLRSPENSHSRTVGAVDATQSGDGVSAGDADTYPIPEGEPTGDRVYNVVTVQVVIWDA